LQAATKVPAELLLDVARQSLAVLLAEHREKRGEVRAHHDVQHRCFGLAAHVEWPGFEELNGANGTRTQ
jgi:hypothetical protein